MSEKDSLAKKFHEIYERLAPKFNYKTREKSAVKWEDVPEDNKQLMIATVTEFFKDTTTLFAIKDVKVLGIWHEDKLYWKFSLGVFEHEISDKDLKVWLHSSRSGLSDHNKPYEIIQKRHTDAYLKAKLTIKTTVVEGSK